MSDNRIKYRHSVLNICFCAVFAALVCVCTFISVPLPFGYFNLGDFMILLCAWTMGPLYGAVSAAVGAGLADLLMAFTLYIPATVIIKALMAVCAYFTLKAFKRLLSAPKLDFIPRILSAVCAEAVMITGYFAFEYILYGGGAVASIPGNALQGICAVIGGVALGRFFEKLIGERLLSRNHE